LEITQDFAPTVLLIVGSTLFAIKDTAQVGYGTYVIEFVGVITVIFQYKQL
jgi:hypothetical protein